MTADEESMLDDLLAVESGLRGKDVDFLESLDENREFPLSQKQLDWLDDLAGRHL